MDLNKTFHEIDQLRLHRHEAEFRWRYEIGTKANEFHDKLLNSGSWWYSPFKKYKREKITGVGELFCAETGLSKADVSRCRSFARLWSWMQVERRMEFEWTWSFFRLMIHSQKELGEKIYYMPLVSMDYDQFIKWVDMLKRSPHSLPREQKQ